MINESALTSYLLERFRDADGVSISKMGSGVQGAGYLAELRTPAGIRSYVIKALIHEGLGHDYPSDRAAVFLLDLDEYNNLPCHVKAMDVLAEMDDHSLKSVGGGKEYYLLMEKADGDNYFNDLDGFAAKDRLAERDKKKIVAMASYLAHIHSVKKDAKTLYFRKLRDTVGHGECLMGVFDTYPDGVLSYEEMADVIKKSVDWIARLKPKFRRLSQIHGDFHPGNIWFRKAGSDGECADFVLLDRSRGPWGEPADDVTALTINYIFFSIKYHGEVSRAFLEGLKLFFEEYLKRSRDKEISGVVAPFYAFRGAVVGNPVFYPDITPEQRGLIFKFVRNVLDSDMFEIEKVKDYLR